MSFPQWIIIFNVTTFQSVISVRACIIPLAEICLYLKFNSLFYFHFMIYNLFVRGVLEVLHLNYLVYYVKISLTPLHRQTDFRGLSNPALYSDG